MRPVVAGRIARQSDGKQMFNYGQSYLARKNAIAIYDSELPLRAGEIPLHDKLQLPSCIRDASPDAWGRRVIINRTLGLKGRDAGTAEPDELTYLLESGSDRIWRAPFSTLGNELCSAPTGKCDARRTDAICRTRRERCATFS